MVQNEKQQLVMNSNKIVVCGTHESGWEIIKFLLENGITINYFVSVSQEKAKKLKISGFNSFEDLADQYGIPIYYVDKYSMNSDIDIEFFQTQKFDLLIQGGWQRLFPLKVLNSLRIGSIGVHGSSDFLPQGRGRSPLNWSLIEGKRRFIMHYFLMKEGADNGDIFHFEMFDVNDWDDINVLYYKYIIVIKKTLLEWIPKLLSGNYQLTPQIGEPTYYPKRSPDDGLINWSRSVFEIYNFVRALTKPYPGAFSFANNKRINIWKAQPFDTIITYYGAKQGEVLEIFHSGEFVVNCNSGLLLVTQYEYSENLYQGLLLR